MEGFGGETTTTWLEPTTKKAWHTNLQSLGLLQLMIAPRKAIQNYNVHTT